jgi:Concanavalin A-like lectin/glucanases superfamily
LNRSQTRSIHQCVATVGILVTALFSNNLQAASARATPPPLNARVLDAVPSAILSTASHAEDRDEAAALVAAPSGLSAAYGFDEGTGTSTADASGNGQSGTLSGTSWTSGKFGGALSFNGTTSWITIPSSPQLGLTTGTLEAWIRPNTLGRWNGVIAKGNVNSDAKHNYAIEIDTSNLVNCEVGNGTSFNVVKSTAPVTAGQFIHLACTWDGRQLRLYINGALNRTTTQTVTPAANTSPLFIGQYGGNVDRFAGLIDEVRIYSIAQPQSAIQADMASAIGNVPADTTAPLRSAGSPSGTLGAGTTQATLRLTTDESATCRYGMTPGTAYDSLAITFTTTGTTAHSTSVTGLTNGGSYTYYVRCSDNAGNADPDDFTISFFVAQPTDSTPPLRSSGQPSGALIAGTTQATLQLTTNESATCHYGQAAGTPYAALASFTTTGGSVHSTAVAGLTNGGSYTFYVRCSDSAGNANPDDWPISFSVAQPTDTTPPVRTAGQPAGTLAAGTTQATLRLTTDEAATCRYGTSAGIAYSALPAVFSNTGSTAHSSTVTGLANGASYTYYVRCSDLAGNVNPDDFTIAFTVAQPSPSVRGAYAFDEGAGTNAADASGNGQSGAISGASWSTGKFGGALSFNGTTGWVTVGSSSQLSLTTGTLEAWVRVAAPGRWNGVIAKGNVNSDAKHNYAIEIDDANLVNCEVGNGTTFNVVKSTTPVTAGQFIHLACTWDGTQLRLYINGALNRTVTQTVTPAANTSPLYFGQYGGNVDRFSGLIDEIRIYGTAQPQSVIQADMNTAIGNLPPDTIAPLRSAGLPTATLSAGTTQATLRLTTDEAATCRYGTTPGISYSSLPASFSTTGATAHAATVTGLTDGSTYSYYVRCSDSAGNVNSDDFAINFMVAQPVPDFSVNAAPGSQSVVQGNTATYTVTVSAVNGFAGAVGLDATNLPPGATAKFTPATLTGSGNSILTVATSASTPPGTVSLTLSGMSGTAVRSTTAGLVVIAPTYSVSGSIGPAASGASANVSAAGSASATTSADGSGSYTFPGLPDGSYTITPSKPGFTFTPASRTIVIAGAGIQGLNFTAAQSTSSVAITAPANGASVANAFNISATASAGTAGVQFRVDGVNVGPEDTSVPYSMSLTAPAGAHTLTAVARDGAGNTVVSTGVRVTVGSGAGTTLTINGAQKFQTMDGLGVNINALSWMNGQLQPALDMLADQLGATLWRVCFDMEDWEGTNDDGSPATQNWTYYNTLYSSPKFQNLWGTLRYLNQKGIRTGVALSFMGRVPTWMGGSVINTTAEDEWVEMMWTLVYYARNTEHLDFEMLDPLNEPDWDGIEGPQVNAAQYTRLLRKLSVALDSAGLSDMRFLGPNTASVSSGVNTYLPQMMADSVVMSRVDHFGLHDYSGSTGGADNAIKNSAYPSRNFWMTEFTAPAHILSFLSQNPSGLMLWEAYDSVFNHAILAGRGSTAPNDDTAGSALIAYNNSTGTYTPRQEFYQVEQMIRFVPKGAVRLGAAQSNGNLTVYSFSDPVTGRLTIIGRNTSASAISMNGSLSNLQPVSGFQLYQTYGTNNFARGGDVVVSGTSFYVTVQGNSYFTLTTAPQ